jgi:DNA 3'-phosphatase
MNIISTHPYLIHGCADLVEHDTVYGFDFDGTVIQASGAKWVDTWALNEPVCALLRNIRGKSVELGTATPIVIFTNQGGVAKGNVTLVQLIRKLDAVFGAIFAGVGGVNAAGVGGVNAASAPPFIPTIYIGLSQEYRKPSPKMYEEYLINHAPGVQRGYFVGDASDATQDFSDSDYRFAKNAGLEYVRVEDVSAVGVPVPTLQSISDYFRAHTYVAPITGLNRERVFADALNINIEQIRGSIVIMIGYPGSGKSTFATWLHAQLPGCILRRDELGTVAKVQKRFREAVGVATKPENTPTIIVDATHPSIESRKYYIEHAAGRRMIAVVLQIDRESAFYLNKIRGASGNAFVPSIAYGVFAKKYEFPTLTEGFSAIITIDKLLYDPAVTPEHKLDWLL